MSLLKKFLFSVTLFVVFGNNWIVGQARLTEVMNQSQVAFGTGFFHSQSTTLPETLSTQVEAAVLPSSIHFSYNPFAPYGGNDGAAWQGRGFNTWSTFGAKLMWGPLSLRFEPEVSWAENQDFEIMKSPSANRWGDYGLELDRLQRFGDKAFFHWDWGNTEIRLRWGLTTLGLGTEAIWLGGAERNSLILSDNAGGFPHFDFGTLKPWKTDWGTFEARFLWGALFGSDDYLNHNWSFDRSTRFFHALIASYSPPFLENLTVGYARAFVSPWSTRSWWKAFQSINDGFLKWTRVYDLTNGAFGGEDDIDQLVSIYFNLDFPSIGFSLHSEIARNDHSGDWRDFIRMPYHAGAFVLGVSQETSFTDGWSGYYRLELANLLAYEPLRTTGPWYRHALTGGHTSGGQVLGAAIGPGSNTQYGTVGLRYRDGWFGLEVERIEKDTDFQIQINQRHRYNNVTTKIGVQGGFLWSGWGAVVSIGRLDEINRDWLLLNDFSGVVVSGSITYSPLNRPLQ